MESLADAVKAVRLAVFDFDGCSSTTPSGWTATGGESVRCCHADGFGLRRLEEVGVETLIVSTEMAPVVTAPAKKVGVECIQGVEEKLPVVPADAWPEARALAYWVLTRNGGEGCVGEFCDAIWLANGGTPA